MIRIILLLLVIGSAIICGPLLSGNKGYVLIAMGDYTIEMSVVSAGIMALLLYGILLLLESLLARLFRLKGSTRNWLIRRRRSKARQQTLAGTLALAKGEFRQAEALLLKNIRHSEQPLLNYLSAAEAARKQGKNERRDEYLLQAEAEHPDAALAIGLIRARQLLQDNELAQAQTELEALLQIHPRHPAILALLKDCYLARGQWTALLELLPQLLKRKLLDNQSMQQLQHRICPQLFAEQAGHAGIDGIQSLLQKLPKGLRQAPEIQAAAARALVGLGEEEKARELLLNGLHKLPNTALLQAVCDLQQPAPALLARLQKHEKVANEPAPELLQAIGVLLLRQRDFMQAQQYLERVATLAPSSLLYLQLAQLMEQQRLFEKASSYYRQSLNLAR